MEEPISLSFYVTIDPNLPREVDTPVVAWGDFVSEHPEVAIYEPGSMPLSRFYVDLIMGRSFALQFATHAVSDLECLAAITLFLDRSLALHPKTSSFVAGLNMVSSLGAAGMAHIDRDLARFILFLEQYTVQKKVSKKEMEQKLMSAVQLIRAYILEDQLPSLPPEQDPPKVLDTGTNGFVLAEVPKPTSLVLSVVELYRMGHLRGLVFSGQHALAFKKGKFLQFDLTKALETLNGVESGEDAPWYLHPGGVFLSSPPGGTHIPREALIDLFLRV